jgi:uncharacterized protein
MKQISLTAVFLLLVSCAVMKLSAQGTNTDLVERFAEVKAKAEAGDPKAQLTLGGLYEQGDGVSTNISEAIKWWRKSASRGNVDAQVVLGQTYFYGTEIAQDQTEGLKWYRKAAEQGSAFAQYNLGNFYNSGNGVVKDEVEAVKWYRKAAIQGDAESERDLGVGYQRGIGMVPDPVEAVVWFRKAAEQGDVLAYQNLGYCYGSGKGTPKDDIEAFKWFERAAEQNVPEAQTLVGLSYTTGTGVSVDYIQAYKWCNLGSAQGNETAKRNLLFLEQRMTPEQIAEAQKLSGEFVPGQQSDSPNSVSPNNPTVSGTGFLITDDGYLISNFHVVKDARKVRVLTSAGLIEAKVVQVDTANDLALLKVEGTFSPLPIAASRTVNLGGTVATVGFPDIGLQGFAPKLAKGEIASLAGAGDDPRYFQISVPVQPGNSGGALVDEKGNVVGIVSAKLDASAAFAATGSLPENVNYAIKSSLLLSFLESVPDVDAKLKAPNTMNENFEDVVQSAQGAAVLVLGY